MTPRTAAPLFALIAAMTSLTAQAEDACTQVVVYAVQQFCSRLPNGQSLCQPMALTGPSPACKLPQPDQFKPVPLAPPTVQFPMATPMMVPDRYPAMPPAMPPVMPPTMPAAPYNPYLASPMTPQPVSPFGASLMPFMPPQAAAVPAMPQATAPAAASTATPAPQASASSQPEASSQPVPHPAALAPLPSPVTPAPVAIAPASPAKTASSAPEAVTPDLPEAPMLPVVVAEARALFDFDSAELTSLGKETLDSWLATAPVGMPVVVSGHADRLGPEDYNLELSLRRATAARDYLVAKGKDVRDIRIVAKGELEPVKRCKGGPTDATKACLAPNRRVLITPE